MTEDNSLALWIVVFVAVLSVIMVREITYREAYDAGVQVSTERVERLCSERIDEARTYYKIKRETQ